MATIVITFDKGLSNVSDNNYLIEIKRGAAVVGTHPVALPHLRDDPPTNEAVRQAIVVLLKEMVERSGLTTKSNGKSFLDSASITFDFPTFP